MREMKDSGVAWIGEIPSNWETIKIKYIADSNVENSFIDGDWIESGDISESGIRYYTTGNVGDGKFKEQGNGYVTEETFKKLNCKFAYPDDLVISRLNEPYGRSCLLPSSEEKCVLAVDIVILRPNGNFEKKYLCYQTQCTNYQAAVGDKARGTAMKRISRSNLGNIQMIQPPLPEQRRIADYLDTACGKVDALIANQQAQIEKLKAYKQSLITEVVTHGLDPDAPMKDSGVEWIGMIPEGWEVVPSKSCFKNSDERRKDGDVQLTASQKHGMISQQDYMQLENARIVLADKGLENWKHVEPFDFVISLRSFQGGLEMSEISGCATWHYIVLRAKRKICAYYFKWLFKSSMYIRALQMTCNYIRDGQDLRYSNFIQVPLCIPPIDVQQQIADYLDTKCAKIDALIAIKQQKIEKLTEYKKSLIYEYVTGKKEA